MEANMSVKNKFKSFFAMDEEEYEEYEDYNEYTEYSAIEEEPVKESRSSKKKVVQFKNSQKDTLVVLIEPSGYADAQVIADNLRANRSVFINLHKVQGDVARRILDFVSGFIYSINGDVKRVGSNTFIATPESVGITGSIDSFEKDTPDNQTGWI